MEKQELTVIDAIIEHSRAIFTHKIFLQNIKKFGYLLGITPDSLPTAKNTQDNLLSLTDETERRIAERQEACKKYLLQMFQGETYGFKDNFYLSSRNLQDGYVLLYKNVSDEIASKVLYLSDSEKNKKGDIIDFNKCKDDLLDLNSRMKPGDLLLQAHFQ